MFYIMDFDGKRAWSFTPSLAWLRRHDNGHAVSIGFVFGEDISDKQLRSFIAKHIARPVDYEHACHGGCQSACRLRGASECRW